jgi:pimeloyl-ACP methyl ester carboxylesterase
MLFPNPPLAHGDWNAARYGADEHWIANGTTKIHAWVLSPKNARGTLIYCHGNGESLGTLGRTLEEFRDRWQVHVVGFDFRGYGRTGGTPSEINILEDARVLGRWVREHSEFGDKPILVFGRSLGGAAAVEIAIDGPTRGLILDRTFSSIVDVAASRYFIFPVRRWMRNPFETSKKIVKYHEPLLQVHGDIDSLVPLQFGRRLFDACPSNRKEWLEVPGLSHNGAWPNTTWRSVDLFLTSILHSEAKSAAERSVP